MLTTINLFLVPNVNALGQKLFFIKNYPINLRVERTIMRCVCFTVERKISLVHSPIKPPEGEPVQVPRGGDGEGGVHGVVAGKTMPFMFA